MGTLIRFTLLTVLVCQLTGCLGQTNGSEEARTTGSFKKLASMAHPRSAHVSEAANGNIYVIGGVTASGPINLDSVEEYNPATNTWTEKTAMSSPRQGMGSAVYNDKIYIFGGYDNSGVATVEVYDPSNDTWTQLNDMPVAAEFASASTVGSKIYVSLRAVGGSAQNANIYEYDPINDGWNAKSNYPVLVAGHHQAVIGTNIYFIGRSPALIYDTVNDIWSEVADAWGNSGNGGKSTAVLGGMIYLFDESDWASSLQVYKPQNTFSGSGFSSPVMITLGAVATLNNSAFISGGARKDASISSDFYKFDY